MKRHRDDKTHRPEFLDFCVRVLTLCTTDPLGEDSEGLLHFRSDLENLIVADLNTQQDAWEKCSMQWSWGRQHRGSDWKMLNVFLFDQYEFLFSSVNMTSSLVRSTRGLVTCFLLQCVLPSNIFTPSKNKNYMYLFCEVKTVSNLMKYNLKYQNL